MRKVLMIVLLATALVGGCKKKKDEAATAGSAGSAAAGSAEGSAAAGSAEGSAAAGSAEGSAATPTEGSAAAGGDTGAAVPRPASVTDAHVAVADKMIKVFNEFGDAMKTAGTDCKAASAAAKAFVPKFKEIGGEAEKVGDLDKDPDAKKWFEANYAPKMMAAMGPMMQTAQACQDDKEFQAAMQAMQEAMPKDKGE